MRPIDELMRDAEKAAADGKDHILISRSELRQLKDYELVIGTANPDIAEFAGQDAPATPTGFQLYVVENLP